MGSYGVIKEALLVKKKDVRLVKKNGATDEYSVVQKLVPATVNGMVNSPQDGGFELGGTPMSIISVYHGGAFGFPVWSISNELIFTVNIPGYGMKLFHGRPRIENVIGVGNCVMCTPVSSGPSTPYTNLCLVVESPGSVFAE